MYLKLISGKSGLNLKTSKKYNNKILALLNICSVLGINLCVLDKLLHVFFT